MKARILLAVFLLGVGLCFVPISGYGTIPRELYEEKTPLINLHLLRAQMHHMMSNLGNFLAVDFAYDLNGELGRQILPEGSDTKGKILVSVYDTGDVFSNKSGIALLGQFRKELELIYSYLDHIATDLDNDIVAVFYYIFEMDEETNLGYFYQGEYHWWGE